MLVISTREFRDKQKSYLDKIDDGLEVLIQRNRDRAYKIIPATEDDTLMSKEELRKKIDKGLQDIVEGKGREYSLEELRVKMGL
jgi:PHD/YefM family antitoxin component YafN of YafNO toxin-antitoxin module